MSRGKLRPIRRNALARLCAGVIIALVLCPFTAPFASYDPNGSAINLLTQDGSLLDKACDKVVSADAFSMTIFGFAQVDLLTTLVTCNITTDLLLQRSMVLRV